MAWKWCPGSREPTGAVRGSSPASRRIASGAGCFKPALRIEPPATSGARRQALKHRHRGRYANLRRLGRSCHSDPKRRRSGASYRGGWEGVTRRQEASALPDDATLGGHGRYESPASRGPDPADETVGHATSGPQCSARHLGAKSAWRAWCGSGIIVSCTITSSGYRQWAAAHALPTTLVWLSYASIAILRRSGDHRYCHSNTWWRTSQISVAIGSHKLRSKWNPSRAVAASECDEPPT